MDMLGVPLHICRDKCKIVEGFPSMTVNSFERPKLPINNRYMTKKIQTIQIYSI